MESVLENSDRPLSNKHLYWAECLNKYPGAYSRRYGINISVTWWMCHRWRINWHNQRLFSQLTSLINSFPTEHSIFFHNVVDVMNYLQLIISSSIHWLVSLYHWLFKLDHQSCSFVPVCSYFSRLQQNHIVNSLSVAIPHYKSLSQESQFTLTLKKIESIFSVPLSTYFLLN